MSKTKLTVGMILGIILIVMGYYSWITTDVRDEIQYRTQVTSTKGRDALIGGGAGAVVGGGLAAVVGGIGIVACGTGVGIPGGALLIGLSALLGGGAGATIGAAVSEPSVTQTPYNTSILEKSYPPSVSLGMVVLGTLMVIWVIGGYIRQKAKPTESLGAASSGVSG